MELNKPAHQRFAFVIPVYNHQEMIAQVIERVKVHQHPIVVVNDGSTDQTPVVLQGIQGITVLHHPKNLGKGASLTTGFQAAAKVANWAITLDADGQHNPEDTERLKAVLKSNERAIVIGVRSGMDGEHVPWASRFGRLFSNFWVFVSGGPWLKDTQSGFRIYPIPETDYLNARARRYQFEVEILVKAGWAGLPVKEAPISVHYEPGTLRISHFKPFMDFMRNSAAFTRLIIQRIVIPSPIRKRMTNSSGLPRKK